MDTAIIEQMDDNEKLHTMEQLWDTLSKKSSASITPMWHKDVLEERIKVHKSGKGKYLSLDEVRKQLL